MYRASAPAAYELHESGNMFLYSDALYLAEQLKLFAEHHEKRAHSQGQQPRLLLLSDVQALETFGKRAYSREMESQRTIVTDLLDGTQSFTNCTEHPYKNQCDVAVTSTVDRLKEVHMQWRNVLSTSALLQSTGSLLSTVVNKIIVAIVDMSDISEPESRQLTLYCNAINSLEDLFLPVGAEEASDDRPPIPLTAVYAPSWLKFQYLSNILESSLADIKYLWVEGELSLEFTADEVIDLIEALFAESDHRRKAISEIRRNIAAVR